jgi:hypothetical protein
MAEHFAEAFGAYFFAGQRVVLLAFAHFDELKQTPTRGDLYTFALNTLKRRMGDLNPLLHTQYVKRRLLMFIDKVMLAREDKK